MSEQGKELVTPYTKGQNISQKQLRSLEPQDDIRLTIMQTVKADNLIKLLSAANSFVKNLGDGEYNLLLEITKYDSN